MKYILLLIFASLSLFASAQVDSTQIPQTVTLTLKHMAYVKDCIGTSGESSYFKFYRQVATQIDTTTYNASQSITVTVTSAFVFAAYTAVAGQQERIANPINDEIKAALLPQLTNGWLLRQLQAYSIQNAAETSSKVQAGYNYFKSIK
jgi:hypothetical protein